MDVRSSDLVFVLGCLLGLGGLIGLGEMLRRRGWSAPMTRRLVHAGVGLAVAGLPFVFVSPVPVYLLAGVFVIVNAGGKWKRWWPGIHAARPESWGTVTMPLVLIPALAATWSAGADRVFILQIAFLLLALADPLASWVGAAWGRREWIPGATLAGSAVFLIMTLLLTGAGLFGIAEWSPGRAVVGALLVAPVVTAVEAVSRWGWDNVSVVVAVLLVLIPLHETPGAGGQIGLALAIGLAFGGAAYATRMLAAAGAVGGGLFAASLVGLGGWAWALPGFVFFVLSSGLSLLNEGHSHSPHSEAEGGGGRQLRQVLANGGVAWLLLSVWAVIPGSTDQLQTACYAGFLGALAAAAADTWATEIGLRLSARPWSLRTWSRVEAGTSGAVSLGGTVGAVLGAASVAGAAALTGGAPDSIGSGSAAGIVGAGLAGMVVDSVAGAVLQARYRDPNSGRLVERPTGMEASLVQGWRRIDNEVVNGLGTAAGALAAVFFF